MELLSTNLRYLYIYIIVLFSSGYISAQSNTVFNYSLEEGLPSSEVYQVYQDKEGFIWFATDNGIVKFDGKEMQLFHLKDGLSDPVVFGFQEDNDGRVWLKSYTGRLSYLDNGKIRKYKYNDKISEVVKNGIPNFVFLSDLKQLKFIVRNVLCQIDSLGNVDKEIIGNEGLNYLSYGNQGIWELTNYASKLNKIFINNQEYTVSLSEKPYFLSEYNCPSRSIYWKNKLYLTIKNNVFSFDGNTVERVYAGYAPIISLSKDLDDNLWIGYMNAGTEKFTSFEFNNSTKLAILNDKSITSVLQDRENGLWLSTLESGVYYIPNPVIENFITSSSSKITHVLSRSDSVFISNQQGNFLIFQDQTKRELSRLSINSPVLSFFITKNGRIWLYTDSKVQVLDHALQIDIVHRADANTFGEEKNGNIWAYGGGKMRKFNFEGQLLQNDLLSISYRSFLLHDSLFFFAGKTGLHIRNRNLDLISSPEEFSDYKISGFTTLSDSMVLVNTLGNGFFVINTNSWSHQNFDSKNNFIADNVYTAIVKDDMLWLGTEVGVVLLGINSLLQGHPQFTRWDKKSGLISDNIKFLTVTNHNTWAFSDNGYSVIPNDEFQLPVVVPTAYLKSIEVNDSIYSSNNSKKLELNYDKTKITLRVGYLSFKNQDIVSRFRILKKNQWEYSKARVFQFSSLAPADYSFELEYSIDNINWVSSGIQFDFTVLPPLWQRWYFQAGIVLVIISIILFYFKIQISNYKEKNRFLSLINKHQQNLAQAEFRITERERESLSKELHDGVSMDIIVAKLKVMELLRHIDDKSKLSVIEEQFQTAIKSIKSIAYGLSPPGLDRYGLFTAVTSYTNKISESIEVKIHLNLYGADIQKSDIAISIFRILQELINNSLRHSQASNIRITINSFNDLINLIYEDDGIGFSPEHVSYGLGLSNIEARIQSIGGKVVFESTNFGVSYSIDIPSIQPLVD